MRCWVVAAALEEFGVQTVRERQERPGVQFLAGAAALRRAMGAPVKNQRLRNISAVVGTRSAAMCSEVYRKGEARSTDAVLATI
jgi:hypothetical protein